MGSKIQYAGPNTVGEIVRRAKQAAQDAASSGGSSGTATNTEFGELLDDVFNGGEHGESGGGTSTPDPGFDEMLEEVFGQTP